MKKIFWFLALCPLALLSCKDPGKQNSTEEKPTDSLEVRVDTQMVKLLFPEGKDILTGGDGAISISIDNTKSFWLWGDSFLGEVKDNKRDSTSQLIIGNIWTLLDSDKVSTICGGSPQKPESLINIGKVNGNIAFLWPMHGFVKNNIVHVFMSVIVRTGDGIWDFFWHASQYYRLSYPDMKVIDMLELEAPFKNKVHYGFGVFEDNGYYYVYGTAPDGLAAPLHVARAKLINDKLNEWEYFDGQNWDKDPTKTKAMAGITVPVSEQFSVFKHNDKYILVTQDRGIRTDGIYTFVADKPQGDWSNPKKVYSTPELNLGSAIWTYSAMAHPQYDVDGKLLISYCVNTHHLPDLFNDVSIYKPRFIRVPYSLILNK
ncbi:DUF4185 domain-containing protein [Dysgonomonas macrotermitis]|uniref:DUF4185 domain-containing protein n=1 Tax=Dysgonomonas macrotermitis TaxID=1346286 RepID=A0A1M4W5W7_9BACT|nr:DUF4185 domain-containing protein [Dysgonomonas macrotermitis]SHE76674.1 protein of unknown function [Dysgonomonas macrotermitis]